MSDTIERKNHEIEIIVFRHDGRLLVKRVVTMPGDWRTGRGNSFDSRYWKHLFVSEQDIVAKVLLPDGQRGQPKK